MKKIIVSLLLFTHGIMLPASEGHTTQSSYFVISAATALNKSTDSHSSHPAKSNPVVSNIETLTSECNPSLSQIIASANSSNNLELLADAAIAVASQVTSQVASQKKECHLICNVCSYKTHNTTHFKEHMTTHAKEKPYKCDECAYQTGFHKNIKRHKKGMHSHKKPLTCRPCKETFKRYCEFKKHKKAHLKTRPFKCDNCRRRFRRKHQLLEHEKSHPKK